MALGITTLLTVLVVGYLCGCITMVPTREWQGYRTLDWFEEDSFTSERITKSHPQPADPVTAGRLGGL